MADYADTALSEAKRSIASTLGKSEKALAKLKVGTHMHTTTALRIQAYRIAITLIENELAGGDAMVALAEYSADRVAAAQAALADVLAQVEAMLPKLEAGTAQHTLTVRRIEAFRIAGALLAGQAARPQ